jgi:L-lactate dehydrogenase (cytochrome)
MGKEGVTLALEIIRKELDITMALCGKRNINDIDQSVIQSVDFK